MFFELGHDDLHMADQGWSPRSGLLFFPAVDFSIWKSNLESKPDRQLVRPFRNNAIGGSMTENPPQFDKMTE